VTYCFVSEYVERVISYHAKSINIAIICIELQHIYIPTFWTILSLLGKSYKVHYYEFLRHLLPQHTNITHPKLLQKNYPTITPGKSKWKNFSQIIENAITLNFPLTTPSDLDTAVHSFLNIIQDDALDAS